MASKKSETANPELIERLKGVLRKYFETDDNGKRTKSICHILRHRMQSMKLKRSLMTISDPILM